MVTVWLGSGRGLVRRWSGAGNGHGFVTVCLGFGYGLLGVWLVRSGAVQGSVRDRQVGLRLVRDWSGFSQEFVKVWSGVS